MLNLSSEIFRILDSMRVPGHLKGYFYLYSAIKICAEALQDTGVVPPFMAVIYPKVAESYGSTPTRVERSIRTAIESAFNRGAAEVACDVLGAYVGENSGKITNSEFIFQAAKKVVLVIKPDK